MAANIKTIFVSANIDQVWVQIVLPWENHPTLSKGHMSVKIFFKTEADKANYESQSRTSELTKYIEDQAQFVYSKGIISDPEILKIICESKERIDRDFNGDYFMGDR